MKATHTHSTKEHPAVQIGFELRIAQREIVAHVWSKQTLWNAAMIPKTARSQHALGKRMSQVQWGLGLIKWIDIKN